MKKSKTHSLIVLQTWLNTAVTNVVPLWSILQALSACILCKERIEFAFKIIMIARHIGLEYFRANFRFPPFFAAKLLYCKNYITIAAKMNCGIFLHLKATCSSSSGKQYSWGFYYKKNVLVISTIVADLQKNQSPIKIVLLNKTYYFNSLKYPFSISSQSTNLKIILLIIYWFISQSECSYYSHSNNL